MASQAVNVFSVVIDHSQELMKELRHDIFKNLNVDNFKLESLIYFIEENIEQFEIIQKEQIFLKQIQDCVYKEISSINQLANPTDMDYKKSADSLMQKLKNFPKVDIDLIPDFKSLANKVYNKFGNLISSEELYTYLLSRKDRIMNLIEQRNEIIINALINNTYGLFEEMKKINLSRQNSNLEKNGELSKNENSIENIINNLINISKSKYNEMQRRLSYLASKQSYKLLNMDLREERGNLLSISNKLYEFINNLVSGKYSQEMINKYINEKDINVICEKILVDNIPNLNMVNNLTIANEQKYGKNAITEYSKYQTPIIDISKIHNDIVKAKTLEELLVQLDNIKIHLGKYDYDTNKKLEEEYLQLNDRIIKYLMQSERKNNPNPNSPNSNAEIGKSTDDIESLINSNKIYDILHGISKEQTEQYKDFIMTCYNKIFSKFEQKAKMAKSYEEQQIIYQDLYNIYNNFKDYLPMEILNNLQNSLDQLETILRNNMPEVVVNRRNDNQQAKAQMKL